jgi:hypothetical protein
VTEVEGPADGAATHYRSSSSRLPHEASLWCRAKSNDRPMIPCSAMAGDRPRRRAAGRQGQGQLAAMPVANSTTERTPKPVRHVGDCSCSLYLGNVRRFIACLCRPGSGNVLPCVLLVSRLAESAIGHGSMLSLGLRASPRRAAESSLRNPQTSLLQARSDRNHSPMRTYPGVASRADRLRTLRLRPDGMNQ